MPHQNLSVNIYTLAPLIPVSASLYVGWKLRLVEKTSKVYQKKSYNYITSLLISNLSALVLVPYCGDYSALNIFLLISLVTALISLFKQRINMGNNNGVFMLLSYISLISAFCSYALYKTQVFYLSHSGKESLILFLLPILVALIYVYLKKK